MPIVADIVRVDVPSQAAAGDTVIVDVSVRNIGGSDQYVATTGAFDSEPLSWQFDYLLVSPGQTVIMRGWFTMPSKKARVQVWSWYWDGSVWQVEDEGDDYQYRDVGLSELVPEFANVAITRYEKL